MTIQFGTRNFGNTKRKYRSFYGYITKGGAVHVKRCYDDSLLEFNRRMERNLHKYKWVFPPFKAPNLDKARKIVNDQVSEGIGA